MGILLEKRLLNYLIKFSMKISIFIINIFDGRVKKKLTILLINIQCVIPKYELMNYTDPSQ